MLRAFYSGISGLRNHQQAMDVVGNNLANVNTTAYKSSRATFVDTLSQTMQGARAGDADSGGKNPMQVGLGMTVATIDRDVSQGALQSTGRNLDMAIEGEGWFVVGTTDAVTREDTFYYSRNGSFFVDDNYNLVNVEGDLVYGWVDNDLSGDVDPTRDQMDFINLDRLQVGSITNALASSTPAISGPNQGDARIGQITTGNSTVSDSWRVECVNAQQGWFRVSGTRTGVIGNYSYSAPISDGRLGTFNIDMGPPAQARLSTPFIVPDNTNESFSFDNSGGAADLTVSFVAGITASGGVEVMQNGNSVSVTLPTDIDGNVTATFNDVETTINSVLGAGFATYSGTAGGNAMALVNQVVSATAGGVTDLALGDVAPVGFLGWTANEYGAGGNNLNIVMINRGAQQRTTEVVLNGSTISVYLKADSAGNVAATAADVYAAFLANSDASELVTMDDPTGQPWENMLVQPFSQTFFGGGSGANLGDYFTLSTTAPGGAKLESISVNREGGVIGVFENGSTEELARIALANVPNPQGMVAVGQGKFAESPVSGTGFPLVVAGTGGTGGIASGFLEMSNVDLTREFTNMIVQQRGFQANSRIITTSDEMLQELMALKR